MTTAAPAGRSDSWPGINDFHCVYVAYQMLLLVRKMGQRESTGD